MDRKKCKVKQAFYLSKKPVDSNRVIKEKGWTKVQPFTILAYYDILD